VGSRLNKDNDLAYIAGFLDGDGSLMIQIKKRSDTPRGIRVMLTICFYQDSRHEKPLYWIRDVLGCGYLSRRNDGMTELRVNGFETVAGVLRKLLPFIKFKRIQAEKLIESAVILQKKNSEENLFRQLVDNILAVQSENYVTRKKRSKQELLKLFNLTP
jgi:hypothetical protein